MKKIIKIELPTPNSKEELAELNKIVKEWREYVKEDYYIIALAHEFKIEVK